MTTPNESGPASVYEGEARLLTPEELQSMFKPKVSVGGKDFDFDLSFITGTANTEEELNGWANLRIGDEFVPRKDWREEQKRKIDEFRQNLSSGSEKEQKLAEEINNFQKFVDESEDFDAEIEHAVSDSVLSDEDRQEKIYKLAQARDAQEIEADKRIQYLGSLFRDIAKLPKITQGGVDQFLDLPENQELRVKHIANFASNFKHTDLYPERVETVMASRFINEVPEGEIREAYWSVKNRLEIWTGSDEAKEDEKLQQELIKLNQFKLFLEKKFPYLVAVETSDSPVTKERTIMDRFKSIGAYFSTKLDNLIHRKATETIPDQVEPKLDAISSGAEINAEDAVVKISDETGTVPSAETSSVVSTLTPEDPVAPVIEVVAPVEDEPFISFWGGSRPRNIVEPAKPVLASAPVAPVKKSATTEIKPEDVALPGVETTKEGAPKLDAKTSTEKKMEEPVSPEKKKAALERIWKKIEQSPDWYNKQPTKVKLAVSAGLIVAGLAGVAVSSGVILGGVAAAKYTLRAVSAFAAAKGVGNMLEGKSYARKAMLATFLGTFALGSYSGDILKSVGGVLSDLAPDSLKRSLSILNSLVTNELKPIQEELTQKLGSVKDEVVQRFNTADQELKNWREGKTDTQKLVGTPPNEVLPTDSQTIKSQPISQAPASAPVAVDSLQSASPAVNQAVAGHVAGMPVSQIENAVGSGVEQLVEISSGDTLSQVMMDNIGEQFPGFDDLSPKGQANFIYNILSNLSSEQLKEIGVSSMDTDVLSLNDKIDFQKFHDIAKDMSITYGGESLSFFERAKLLK